jgi:c-di-GMP-binding flagellar brake protein YcgR
MWPYPNPSKEPKLPDANLFMERRVFPRIKVNISVQYRLVKDKREIDAVLEQRKKDGNAHALDLSLGGMHISADQSLKEGDILNFEISLPGLSVTLSAFAEVVWANRDEGGLHFLEMAEEDLRVLKAYLKKASSTR